jgi:hypothetical protein
MGGISESLELTLLSLVVVVGRGGSGEREASGEGVTSSVSS